MMRNLSIDVSLRQQPENKGIGSPIKYPIQHWTLPIILTNGLNLLSQGFSLLPETGDLATQIQVSLRVNLHEVVVHKIVNKVD